MAAAEPIFTDPKQLLLEMAEQRSVDSLLRLVAARLADSPQVALARVWLTLPPGTCDICRQSGREPGTEPALHLVAGAGRSVAAPEEAWDQIDGAFHRFALGERKVGQIGLSGRPLEVPDVDPHSPWVADSDWVRREGITGFGGQPLVHHGRVLGVLAVFTRAPLDGEALGWLRMVANHAAAAIATARAFEEVETLRRRLELETEYLRGEVRAAHYGRFVGQSPALDAVLRQVEFVAPTDATVLITGESGTGKELVAREVHARSRRAARALIKVNCAAVPRDLYESEFFGHVRGAFTGAVRDRVGRFELADGGTLFLDEVGELPLDLQPKLLRVLQEGEFERVGEERTRKADVRVIVATNRDLRREAEAGRFRPDLYFRLGVFPIEVPPLRRRPEDVVPLGEHFLEQAAKRLGRPVPKLTPADAERLRGYPWPGNVRELQHVIERAAIVSAGRRLALNLPEAVPAADRATAPAPAGARDQVLTEAEFRDLERQNIRAALRKAAGKIYGPGGAAELLGLKPTTLASRMKALGVRPAE
ncbi:sigma 54-interacting transcriptional regulator [Gemmata sp. JC717]|uniref:sigma-54-dependent Fis family transcriptional regulator n=1 Tax=Gemmata algarum TaxID=2975278 RepID=UPI0021BAFF22|nr:sigma 54-interacting transcriptional regulator [Gemmata algarum]MDY3551687.1 sigma 54-interacting transcriptional regulator [Gemmata algarum]